MRKKQNIRTLLGISQENLALILQVSRSQIAMYEIGKRSLPIHAMEKLANILSVLQNNKVKKNPLETFSELEEQFLKNKLQKNKHQQLLVENKINTLKKKQNAQNSSKAIISYLLNKNPNMKKNEIALLKAIEVKSKSKAPQKDNLFVLQLELKKEVLQFEEKLLKEKITHHIKSSSL